MIEYRFTLELTDDSVQKRITVHQGEVNFRKLIINFSEHGKPFDLNPYSIVAFRAITAKGNSVFNRCTVAGNCIEYTMTSATVADAGLAEAQIDIYDSDTVLYSPRFNYYVTEALYSDTIIIKGQNEFTALQKVLTDTSELYEDLGSLQEVSAEVEQNATLATEQRELAEAAVRNAQTIVDDAKAEVVEAAEGFLIKSEEAAQAAENSATNAAMSETNAGIASASAHDSAITAGDKAQAAYYSEANASNYAVQAQEMAETAYANSETARLYAEQAETSAEGIEEFKTAATEAKSRVEQLTDALSKNKLLYNIEGNNWELLGSDEEVTAYTLINDVSVNLLADRYYNFSIITPKSGDFATLRVRNYGEFLLKYSDDRYVGKIVFPTRFVGISGWVVEIQNPTDTTYLLSASAPVVIEEEILPDRVKVYLDNSPTWEESTGDEATHYSQGIMHVMDNLELAADKEYKLSCNIGVTITNETFLYPDIYLVKKTTNGQYTLLGQKTVNVNDGVASSEFVLNDGVEQGETLYLSLQDTSGGYVNFDTSSSEVVIEWVSNTKEILDYLSLNSGGNESLGDIEAALDGIIAIQNELIGGDEE